MYGCPWPQPREADVTLRTTKPSCYTRTTKPSYEAEEIKTLNSSLPEQEEINHAFKDGSEKHDKLLMLQESSSFI